MAQIYTVSAYSPSLNQTIRQIDLTNIMNQDSTQAHQMAEQFVAGLNRQFHMAACDWCARVELESVGLTTIPGYQR